MTVIVLCRWSIINANFFLLFRCACHYTLFYSFGTQFNENPLESIEKVEGMFFVHQYFPDGAKTLIIANFTGMESAFGLTSFPYRYENKTAVIRSGIHFSELLYRCAMQGPSRNLRIFISKKNFLVIQQKL